ncbi:MAG TPA: hypothetical protein VM261_12580 [Kofleriaceae bacterium]|nr:hypothetical protein [Kofleriaceae bacterium]
MTDPDALDTVRAAFAACGTLAEALVAGLRLTPPWGVVDVVVQDEYTHDLVFQADGTPDSGHGPAILLDCT